MVGDGVGLTVGVGPSVPEGPGECEATDAEGPAPCAPVASVATESTWAPGSIFICPVEQADAAISAMSQAGVGRRGESM